MVSRNEHSEIQTEQEHVPPQLPENEEELEVEKNRMARLIPAVVVIVALVFVVGALLAAL